MDSEYDTQWWSFNRVAALEHVERQGLDPEEAYYCVQCGRTIIRRRNAFNAGSPDRLFCTCENYGPPFVAVIRGE